MMAVHLSLPHRGQKECPAHFACLQPSAWLLQPWATGTQNESHKIRLWHTAAGNRKEPTLAGPDLSKSFLESGLEHEGGEIRQVPLRQGWGCCWALTH